MLSAGKLTVGVTVQVLLHHISHNGEEVTTTRPRVDASYGYPIVQISVNGLLLLAVSQFLTKQTRELWRV